jgi:hypothetical protein
MSLVTGSRGRMKRKKRAQSLKAERLMRVGAGIGWASSERRTDWAAAGSMEWGDVRLRDETSVPVLNCSRDTWMTYWLFSAPTPLSRSCTRARAIKTAASVLVTGRATESSCHRDDTHCGQYEAANGLCNDADYMASLATDWDSARMTPTPLMLLVCPRV